MSIKTDMDGTNAYQWNKKQRDAYLATVDTDHQISLESIVTECPYRFVCECVTRTGFRAALKEDEWWKRQGYAEKTNESLREELQERMKLEHDYWYHLQASNPAQAEVFADMVLVSNL